MPSDANGNYTLPASYFVQNGDTILPVQHNPPFEDVAQAQTDRVMRDGRSVWTGDMKAGGFKVTGLAAGVAAGDAISMQQIGIDVQAYDADTTKNDVANTFTARQTVQISGADGLVLDNDTGTATNSVRQFFESTTQTWSIFNFGGDLRFSYGATLGSSSGTPKVDMTSDTGLEIDGNPVASVYTGSDSGNLNFPIGTTVIAACSNADSTGFAGLANRNATDTIRLSGSNAKLFVYNTGSGTALSGTWRARGMCVTSELLDTILYGTIFERTA